MTLGRLVPPPAFLCISFLLLLVPLPHALASPTFINGQTFTDGLAIIDSPSPNSPGHAGSSLPIAVDVSGDGQLPLAASVPNSGRPTSFQSLEIYLVSDDTNINITVSNNSTFLTGEPQSTVKHLNWPVPTCLPAGNYNLTFYESSLFNAQFVFAITPLLVQIENPNPENSGQCPDQNPLQPQPQPSDPLAGSPFSPDPLVTLTLTLSNGILNLPTVTVTAQPTPTTVVMISETTVVETNQGTPTTYTETATLTTVVSLPAASSQDDNSSGFIPVNAGSHILSCVSPTGVYGIWVFAYVLLYWA